ncbi:hypothetical protein ACIA8G_23180 [Lentzea sp. NPDC051213]|uniref:hypothetical protein n=1 Tax=Lentzea sp. NPDC051213 TaxID=3364126 RepID=UPI0037BC3257
MKLLPLQWAAVALIVLDAIVVVSTLMGVPVLASWWNLVLVLASAALLVLLLVRSGGALRVKGLKTAFRFLRESLPMWAIVLAALAFYGGWLIALGTMVSGSAAGNLKYENGQYTSTQRKVVKVLTKEQYEAAQAANQRIFSSIGLAVAGGVLGFAGVVRRIKETS